ncbi:MAG: hypothetical protein HY319_18450 [Armatimonadetes bacterium]|nr:hypothetical protein [Armatimonadota bacterium]
MKAWTYPLTLLIALVLGACTRSGPDAPSDSMLRIPDADSYTLVHFTASW